MEWLPIIAQGTGIALETISGINQARDSAEQDKALAKQSIEAARMDEFADRRRSEKIISKAIATAAAANLDIDSGTVKELTLESLFNAELNALQIRKQGEREAAFFKNRAKQTESQIFGIAATGLTKLAEPAFKANKLLKPAPKRAPKKIT